MRAVYLDEARTHSVRVSLVGSTLTIVESAFGDPDPASMLRSTHTIQDAWEVTFHRAELEARLSALGNYWRTDGGLWKRVPSARQINVEPFQLGPASIHHFHHPTKFARTLLAVPASAAGRSLLAELETESLEPREARLLHRSIARGPLRSLVARTHVDATAAGYSQLRQANEFAFLYGPEWQTKLARAIREGVERLATGESFAAPKPAIEQMSGNVVSRELLDDPRLTRIHARFLAAGEEEDLIVRGEHAIRRAIALKRKSANASEQHLLSILEASLLLREGVRGRNLIDPEAIDRVHRLAFYLKAP